MAYYHNLQYLASYAAVTLMPYNVQLMILLDACISGSDKVKLKKVAQKKIQCMAKHNEAGCQKQKARAYKGQRSRMELEIAQEAIDAMDFQPRDIRKRPWNHIGVLRGVSAAKGPHQGGLAGIFWHLAELRTEIPAKKSGNGTIKGL
ncbi:MAG TPA: hypothetical protein PLT03_00510 [Bacillota bacterium]|nr:hypothetical protein [Bacillota bacterium]